MMQLKKKRLLSLTAVTLSISVLAACSNGATSNSNSSQSGSSNQSSQITIRMVESLTSNERTAALQNVINSFESENSNIKVELISPPFDQADNKIRTMLSAEETVDIIEVRDQNVAEFVNNGYIDALDNYASGWSQFDTVTGVAKSLGSVDGKLYFIPNAIYQRQMYYRADWLTDAGIDVPTSYEELVEASIALTDPAKNRYGFSFRGGPGAQGVPDSLIQAYNVDRIDVGEAVLTTDGKTIYATPEAKAALELYVKLYKEGSPPDSINWGFQDQVQAFTSGVTAFILQDPDVIPVFTDSMEEGTWATTFMPVGPSGKAAINAGGAGWGITSHSANKEAAWKLIEYLSSVDMNTQFSKAYGTVPIHSVATEDEFFKSGPYKTLIDMTAKADTFINVAPPFNYPAYGSWSTYSMETGQALLLGQASVEETLALWDEFWVKGKAEKDAQ